MRKKRKEILRNKIRAQKGATLMVALLFFLVCACVGSVVLAAGATSAGRVSSADETGNTQRYAVNSAADLIMSQLNGTGSNTANRNMILKQNWELSYQQNDYDRKGDSFVTGAVQNLQGNYILSLDQDDSNGKWNTTVSNQLDGSSEAETTYDLSQYVSVEDGKLTSSASRQSSDNMEVLRDLLAYGIYRNYWSDVINPDDISDQDPWASMTMGTVDWTSINLSDNTYTISTTSPIKLDVSAKDSSNTSVSIPTVYIAITMDHNFVLTFDLYCLGDNDAHLAEKWLVFTPVRAEVTRTSDDTETVTEADYTDEDKNVIMPNQLHSHSIKRSQTLTIVWDNGELMGTDPSKGSDS